MVAATGIETLTGITDATTTFLQESDLKVIPALNQLQDSRATIQVTKLMPSPSAGGP